MRADNSVIIHQLTSSALLKGVDLKLKMKKCNVKIIRKIQICDGVTDKITENRPGTFFRVFLSKHSDKKISSWFGKKTDVKTTDIFYEDPLEHYAFPDLAFLHSADNSVDKFVKGTLEPNHIKKHSKIYRNL